MHTWSETMYSLARFHDPPLAADLETPCLISEGGVGKTRVSSVQLLEMRFVLSVESQTQTSPGCSSVCLPGP